MHDDTDLESWIPPKSKNEEKQEEFKRAALVAVKEWIEAVTQKKLYPADDFRKSLETGVLLCELVNCLKPSCIRKINRLPTPMASLDNLNVFFACCRKVFAIREGYLFDLHDLEDLSQRAVNEEELEAESQKRLLKVAVCLFWVAKATESSYSGPRLNYSAFSSIIADRNRAFASSSSSSATSGPPTPRTPLAQPPRLFEAPSHEIPRKPAPHLPTAPLIAKTRFQRPSFSRRDQLDLTRSAEEQMKLVEANKKMKEESQVLSHSLDEDAGDWQASFVDWRAKRRQSAANYAQARELKAKEEQQRAAELRASSEDIATYRNLLSALRDKEVIRENRTSEVFTNRLHSVTEENGDVRPPTKSASSSKPQVPSRVKFRTVNLTDAVKAPPDSPFGMRIFAKKSGGFHVVSVLPGSEADMCDVHSGDEVLSINGTDTQELDLEAVQELLSTKNARLRLKRQTTLLAAEVERNEPMRPKVNLTSTNEAKIIGIPQRKAKDISLQKEVPFSQLSLQAVTISTDDSNFSSGIEEGRSSTTITDNSSTDSPETPETPGDTAVQRKLAFSNAHLNDKRPEVSSKPKPRKGPAPQPPEINKSNDSERKRTEMKAIISPATKDEKKETEVNGTEVSAVCDIPKRERKERKGVLTLDPPIRKSSKGSGNVQNTKGQMNLPLKLECEKPEDKSVSDVKEPKGTFTAHSVDEEVEVNHLAISMSKEQTERMDSGFCKKGEHPSEEDIYPNSDTPNSESTKPTDSNIPNEEEKKEYRSSVVQNNERSRQSCSENVDQNEQPISSPPPAEVRLPPHRPRVNTGHRRLSNGDTFDARGSSFAGIVPVNGSVSCEEVVPVSAGKMESARNVEDSNGDGTPPLPLTDSLPAFSYVASDDLESPTEEIPHSPAASEMPTKKYLSQISHDIQPANDSKLHHSTPKSKIIERNSIVIDNVAQSRNSIAYADSIASCPSETTSQEFRRSFTPDVLSTSLTVESSPRKFDFKDVTKNDLNSNVPNCTACAKSLYNEMVTISLKGFGFFFHVGCFSCVKCSKALGDRKRQAPYVLDSRLYCLRCHSSARGLRVLSLGKY